MPSLKKITGYLLVILVLLLTVIAVLGIWEVIDFEHIVRKSVSSLFVVFVATVVILFVFSVMLKEKKED